MFVILTSDSQSQENYWCPSELIRNKLDEIYIKIQKNLKYTTDFSCKQSYDHDVFINCPLNHRFRSIVFSRLFSEEKHFMQIIVYYYGKLNFKIIETVEDNFDVNYIVARMCQLAEL